MLCLYQMHILLHFVTSNCLKKIGIFKIVKAKNVKVMHFKENVFVIKV